jgi:hypothetical protein
VVRDAKIAESLEQFRIFSKADAISSGMALALTDQQLAVVMTVAKSVEPARRDQFLQRVAAMMKFRPLTDKDLADCCTLAAFGLAHQGARSSAA